MGLIRKTLFLTTPGLVSPSSKKQRTAKQSNKLLKEQNALLKNGGQAGGQTAPPPAQPLGKQEGWLNEAATALADLGLAARTRNIDNPNVAGIPPEGVIAFDGREVQVWIMLFANSEQARQAELGFTMPAAQSTVSKGLLRVKRDGRLLFGANGRGGPVDESLLDEVINAVGENDVPPPCVEERPSDAHGTHLGPSAEIERLAQLHAQGVLTDEEFAAAKAKTLGMEEKAEP